LPHQGGYYLFGHAIYKGITERDDVFGADDLGDTTYVGANYCGATA
jgi:hypothetical protein